MSVGSSIQADSTGAHVDVRSLQKPAGLQPLTVHWDSAFALIVFHLLALFAFQQWLFDWTSVVLAILATPVVSMAINLSYHRQLTHRSFQTPKWVEHGLVVMALCNLQNTPLVWVTNHRMHHKFSEGREDPHTPKVSLWWAHCGWLFVKNHNAGPIAGFSTYSPDLLKDPFYRKLERSFLREYIYFGHLLVLFLCGLLWGWLGSGNVQEGLRLGLSFALWIGVLRTVWSWHITWAVNSLCHRYGYRNFDTQDDSRNNLLVGYLTGGEGWHNNHHANPASATTRVRWWELDTVYMTIKLLARLGLATNIKK